MAAKYVTSSVLARALKARTKWTHKRDYGYAMVLAGSEEFAGAAVLNAVAAQRSGAGVVFLVAPRRAADAGLFFSPSLITIPLPGKEFESRHLKKALEIAGKCDSVCIGSGMGGGTTTRKAILEFMEKARKPLVVDAEAIRALEGLAFSRKRKLLSRNIVTPHADEFRSLTGDKVGNDVQERVQKTRAWAARLGCVILLKGPVCVISEGSRVLLNKTGNPLMAVGGTGDVLAGFCAGLLAQGAPAFKAACAAAYATGLAGGIAAKGMRSGLKAEDILHSYDEALKKVQSGGKRK